MSKQSLSRILSGEAEMGLETALRALALLGHRPAKDALGILDPAQLNAVIVKFESEE